MAAPVASPSGYVNRSILKNTIHHQVWLATKRKTLEEEKKHHDTLMGSISVAASFKGFLKQTAKPQERNPFVKAQKNQEHPNKIDEKPAGKLSRNRTVLKSGEIKAEKDTVVENSQESEDTSNSPTNSSKKKEIKTSGSTTNTVSSACDANNNLNRIEQRKRGYSLTEDQKEQLLSLLATGKLNQNSLVSTNNESKSEEPNKQTSKAPEDRSIKPPSPSLYAYPQYGQTEAQIMFNPITPAGRSSSPSVQSDKSESQIPAVPNFVPIAVPIPSVAPVPMPPFWYMSQGGMMPYPQPAMSPVQYVPVDPSMASNRSVVSTVSDLSEVSDVKPRSKNSSSAIPRFQKAENPEPSSEKERSRRASAPQSNKGSKLPRPIWQTPVTKSRATSVESGSNAVRRRTPISKESNEPNEEIIPVRARTPSPSLGRQASSEATTPPRSQTPPVYWNRDGEDTHIPTNNQLQKRLSTGSVPSWRSSSPSSSPDGRRRSSSSPSRSRPNSPVQRPRSGSSSRPSSPVGSRSNSPVSLLVSKFEQMSQETSDNSPRDRSNSVSSMITKFGSSSLLPEDRIVRGQFKPNIMSATASQPASKTGPFRTSTSRDRAQNHNLNSSRGNPISSRENLISSHDRSRTSEPLDDDIRLVNNNLSDPCEVHRSGSDPGSSENKRERLSGEYRRPLSSSLGNIRKECESNDDKYEDSRTRLLETIRKWSSQENIMPDTSSADLTKYVQERCKTENSLVDDYSTKKEMLDEEISTKRRGSSGTFSSERGRSPSSELKNELIVKSSNALDRMSKPLWTKECLSTEPARKSSLDSEPVREKRSPKSRPRDICVTPERDSSMQYCGIKGPNDFLWSATSETPKFEIPVDLAILDSSTPSVSSPLNSVCGFDLTHGGRERSILSPTAPLSPGSLKDFKPSNYFTNVTFKCGEMEPERDTNCLTKRPSNGGNIVSSDAVSNRRDPQLNYVRRFERKILRSTGDVDDEVFFSNSGSGEVQTITPKDISSVDGIHKRSYSETGRPKKTVKDKAKDNPRPVTSSQAKTLPNRFTSQGSSSNNVATSDSKNARTHSGNDPIARSRHPSGDAMSVNDRAPASTSRNPPSPMTLRKLLSSPVIHGENTSQTRPSTSKRNSLPTSPGINLSPNRDPSANRPITKSSSQTNLSPSQRQVDVHKSSSQTNLSSRQTVEGYSSSSSNKGPALSQKKKDNGLVGSNNPHFKGDEIKTNSSAINAKSGNPSNPHPSKERLVAKEHSNERKTNSSSPHNQATKTKRSSASSDTSKNSDSSIVRYPYTRRVSTPVKGSSTIKPPPKAASNPASPLYSKQQKGTFEFFGAPSANYPSKSQESVNTGDRNSNQVKSNLSGTRHNPKQRIPSSEGSSADSSGVGSSPMASPSGSFSKSSSTFELQSVPGDSDVFYIPSAGETFPNSESTSAKANTKRFPSSSSTDSGLNMSDLDENRKGNGNGKECNRVRSPPTSPTKLSPLHSPCPTSPKFPTGTSIFYDPRDQQAALLLSEKDSSDIQKEPLNLMNSSSASQQNEASNPLKSSSTKSTESTNKTVRSDSDKTKNLKGGASKMHDKISLDSNERISSLPENPKDASAALKVATLAQIVRSTSKERLASSTPPPDILGRPSSKSPPSSSRVDSKELLGQLVKKVLNSAAAKQGSSPKASFAEPTSFSPRDGSKGKRATQGKMFFLPEETIGVGEKEKANRQGQNQTIDTSNSAQRLSNADKVDKKKEQRLTGSKDTTPARNQEDASAQPVPVASNKAPITPSSASKVENSSLEEQLVEWKDKDALSKIIEMIHDEFAFDGYLDDGVEDVNMAEYVLSLAGMSEENFKEAITDQYSDLYWDEDLLHEMYEAVTGGQQSRRTTLQFSESTVSDTSPSESVNLSREESYLSLEPLYFNSISRSSSERSGTGVGDVFVSPLGEATEFLPIKVIAPEMQADIHELLTPVFEDYHGLMGIKLASSVEDLSDKLGTKIMEISQQLMLERRAKKKSMNSYNKMADVDNKRDVKDLASKLVNEIEESDKKIIYLKLVQRQLRNVYAERFGLDTTLLHAFVVSYNNSCVTLEPELNNSFLNFSPIWNQRSKESNDIVDESFIGPSLQSGTKLGLFSYLFDRHAMSQAYVRYFLYTFRYIAKPQELFAFIREKCSASLRTDSSGQVYNHQLQIRYRALDLLSEWIDGYYQFDFKTNPNLIKELLRFVKDELILVDRSERGHYLMELIAEKQKQDWNNNSLTEEYTDFVAVLQLEDPPGLGPMEGKKDSLKKPLSSRKAKSPVQCFRRATPEKETTYKATLYLKALSVLDHSSRILAEQLTLIQQDLFFRVHPIDFLNSRAHGIGVGRSQSPSRERDNIFGFSTGSRRISELPGSDQGPLPWEHNLYVSDPSSEGALEDLLEHAQDVSLWVAVEICSASSIKAQLALITKFVNAARYCCEIRNYSTCIQIIDALEMFVVKHLPVWKQVPTKTSEVLEELKAVKVLLKTDSSWLMKSESSRDKPTIPCFLLFIIHVQQQELGGFTLPSDMYKWTKMRSVARLVDQLRLFKQMRYAFQTDEEMKARLKQRILECKNENLHALASENASNFHVSSSHGSRKFHDAFKKMKATFGGHTTS